MAKREDKINERLEVVSNLINQIAFSLEMNEQTASESSDNEPPASDASRTLIGHTQEQLSEDSSSKFS
ncbi:hypothetical protein KEM48_001965 [Puccinia striiformis f. sp. tritici PST-130]|nr:hypothetical protein KEM48_001965 [Puccinia striiformis f. sp. tritici PST-130]